MAITAIYLLAVAISAVPFAALANPTEICLNEVKNSTSGCQGFHGCCQTQCAGSNFTATCSEERNKMVATCVCKGGSTPSAGGRCGRPAVTPKKPPPGRIVGGEQANANSWPWQVSLNVESEHYCGGSLIDDKHVVTAAHCTKGKKPAAFKIRAGLHDQEAPASSYQTVMVEKIFEHPQYQTPMPQSNDISIMRLATPLRFNANLSSVCLPAADAAPGKACVTTGWGDTQGTGDEQYLLQVTIPMVATALCNDSDHYAGKIDDGMCCAGVAGKDSCQGDSGGPLVCQRSDGSWELQGVTSWGRGCARDKNPGVYARVYFFKKWIQDTVKSK